MTAPDPILAQARALWPAELPSVPQIISALHVGWFRAHEIRKAMAPPANDVDRQRVLIASEGHDSGMSLTIELMIDSKSGPTAFELAGDELKPCPFCHSLDIRIRTENPPEFTHCACGICGSQGPTRDNRLNALAMWQRRSY